jgi:putative endonuclease
LFYFTVGTAIRESDFYSLPETVISGTIYYIYLSMSKHSKIGINGEQIASDFLQNKGYKIIFRNWRTGKKEVDIIAEKDNILIFAEVKTRSRADLLYPEETVNRKKQENLKTAAAIFSSENPQYKNIRFDIISILMAGDMAREVVHFEEAFY